MLIRRLPKAIRNGVFVLGMVMITVSAAMEELEALDQSVSSPSQAPAVCHAPAPVEEAEAPAIS